MKIEIGEKYIITSDKLNWILQERKFTDPTHQFAKSDTVKEKIIDIGYFGKLEQLCNSLLNRELRLSEANSIRELKTELNHFENTLKIALEGIER